MAMNDTGFDDDWEFLKAFGNGFATGMHSEQDAVPLDVSPTISSLGSSLGDTHGDIDATPYSTHTPYLSFPPEGIEPPPLSQRLDFGPSLFEYVPKNPLAPPNVQHDWFLSPTCSDVPAIETGYAVFSPVIAHPSEAVRLPLAAPLPRLTRRPTPPAPHAQPQVDNFLSTYFQDRSKYNLWIVLQAILNTPWFLSGAPEPLDVSKRSVFLNFLSHPAGGPEYECLFDGCHASFPRQDRALGHIRKHLEYRPFVCTGPCVARGCKMRFSCRSYLRTHLTRQKVQCKACNARLFPQNMTRHLKTCPRSRK